VERGDGGKEGWEVKGSGGEKRGKNGGGVNSGGGGER